VQSLTSNQRLELARARLILNNRSVTIRDVPSTKSGAADIRLLQDILHHTMVNRTGIIVLVCITLLICSWGYRFCGNCS
jgi:ABC-type transport system involved in cytochrome c biogenesis ATPase subunit